MSKEKCSERNKTKKKFNKHNKTKKNKKKVKMGNRLPKAVPSLSKQQASSNWINFLKSNGMNKKLLKLCEKPQQKSDVPEKQKPEHKPEITKVLSIDCEMVSDLNGADMLARVSIVNYNLQCIYDKFVKPTSEVGDYRTRFSGIREENLRDACDYEMVRKEVLNIFKDKILVGHAVHNDLRVLRMKYQNIFVRDTSAYPPFRKISDSKTPALKRLAKHFLNETVQEGEHCSIEDAKTAMKLYKKFNHEWELYIKERVSNKHKEVDS